MDLGYWNIGIRYPVPDCIFYGFIGTEDSNKSVDDWYRCSPIIINTERKDARMTNKYLNKFLWLHYVFLTGVIFVAHHYSGSIEQMITSGQQFAWVYLFIYYVITVGIGDILIHILMGKIWGWED